MVVSHPAHPVSVLALTAPSVGNWIVGLAVGGIVLLIFLVLSGRPTLTSQGPPPRKERRTMRQQANQWVIRWPFLGQRRFHYWEEQLRLAGAPFRSAELYGVALGLGIAAAALLQTVLGYVLLSLFLGGVAAVSPFLFVRWRAQQNARLLTLQIEAMCLDLAGAAEGGATKMQLLEQAAEAEAPLGALFAGVLAERDQGVSSIDALEHLRQRAQHPQIEGLIQALQIHFERGAPIAPLLREAATDIRIEDELIVEIQTRLEQPRVQFWFVCLLSIPVLLYMRWQDPVAVDGLLGNPIGQIYYLSLWGVALCLYLLVRRLTRIERL
jgi:Flp pilus assembly protein TadB